MEGVMTSLHNPPNWLRLVKIWDYLPDVDYKRDLSFTGPFFTQTFLKAYAKDKALRKGKKETYVAVAQP